MKGPGIPKGQVSSSSVSLIEQDKAMEDLGGWESFMKTYKPYLFSPIPDLSK